MNERKTPSRLDDLGVRLKAAQKEVGEAKTDKPPRGPGATGLGVAMRIGIELVTAVLVGSGIGYLLDQWLGSAPWLMVVFLFLGGAAGVMNVYRVVKGLDDTIGLGRAIREKEKSLERDGEK